MMEQTAWLKAVRKKVAEEMTRKEIEIVLYWKGEIEKVLAKKHEGLGSLQIELGNILQRMQNRAKILKQNTGD